MAFPLLRSNCVPANGRQCLDLGQAGVWSAVRNKSACARLIPVRCQWESHMSVVRDHAEPLAIVFEDDGLVPNNILPFLVYQSAVKLDPEHPEATIEDLFEANGWGGTWRNGVYDYLHYHATVHEVLGVARGSARVRFGGDHGQELDIKVGDVAILPAGTGHQCIKASDDFCVIGAYPPGAKMEITRATPENHAKALTTIPQVALPPADPVTGRDGALMRLWR
ncbi:hypothetical protein C7U92_23955 [Bradyrhizobium sp. WBOS7]|uniref:Cupin domain-containing protein n=2 Tax=Nitrobacteraceae TaxID=41294 RepID=A0AAE9N6V0_9BRAD|nr:hypothetical protein [Bradyrhizobium sp. WBOS2]MDD1570454.1 hypothetical protein [Bradyrhizobium sp. WBOS1]MDD1579755.1 hypothetical protein [Bradyrhizobium sp. WBOS7]MDD1604474.1 hypothetical protein [Bradyrhizobium sp. WBOS16]UUO35071.1 hypothetical protein DCK84_11195 [Bradyrhizobium sp. WBOS01]UUO39601.1 hypothetical protein DCM75_01705 [Bradyrhizobium sp. WBOS02]UUO55716.1 hypothetical protein DCM79_23740 [Bradyrhizobium sp. WBOS07]UUO64068.1 hypothetical protein DCM83_01710 [Bradyrh